MNEKTEPVLGLVGPCKSGKTTLKHLLEEKGVTVLHIAQEHSYVQEMWRKIANPDVLIFLSVSYPETLERSSLRWSESEYNTQLKRLKHAYEHADLVIDTDNKSPQEILTIVLGFLSE